MTRLRRIDARMPGISRRRRGRGFSYQDARGRTITDDETLRRIRSLSVPPAWTDVWICPLPDGHLQALGTDAAGRRQYMYHEAWRTRRNVEKFRRIERFAEALHESVRGEIAQMACRRFARGHQLLGILVAQAVEREMAARRHDERFGQQLGRIDARKPLRCAQVPLAVRKKTITRLGERAPRDLGAPVRCESSEGANSRSGSPNSREGTARGGFEQLLEPCCQAGNGVSVGAAASALSSGIARLRSTIGCAKRISLTPQVVTIETASQPSAPSWLRSSMSRLGLEKSTVLYSHRCITQLYPRSDAWVLLGIVLVS